MQEAHKHALVWLGISTLIGLGVGLFFGYLNKNYLGSLIIALTISYTIWLFMSLLHIFLVPRVKDLPRGRRLRLEIPCFLIADLLGFFIPMSIFSKISNFPFFTSRVFWTTIGAFVVLALIIFGLAYSLAFYRELKEKEATEDRLKVLAAEAELRALRAQINPHFLFNALNAISCLIDTHPQKAQETLERLGEIFRYVLTSSEKEFVPLREELDFIDSYLRIEQERFGNKLQLQKFIDPEVQKIPIPSLILQPLVENCIKHGRTPKGEVWIEISAIKKDDLVELTIADHGKGIPQRLKERVYKNGTGLRNVTERLQRLYGEKYGLQLLDNQPRGTMAVVRIPRERR